METIGFICLLIVGFFIPRTIALAVLASVGMVSWVIATPLLVVAILVDLATWAD